MAKTNTRAQIDDHIADVSIHTPLNVHYVDITTDDIAPMGKSSKELPDDWVVTALGVGKFTITHNLNNPHPGIMLSVISDSGARIINPTEVAADFITFHVVDASDLPADATVIGQILF